VEAPEKAGEFLDEWTDNHGRLHAQTRGFQVRAVLESSPVMIKVAAQAKSTGAWSEITLFVTAAPPDYTKAIPPYQMVGMGISSITAPPRFLSGEKLTDAKLRRNLDQIMSALVAEDAFSGTVTVARSGKPVYSKAFGLASRAWKAPNQTDTGFNLASITKMFTAVAVAQLVERGRLSYGDTVGRVLPDWPNKAVADTVTVHHLLSHTSGLIGARALVEKGQEPRNARTIAEMVKPFAEEPLSFRPGQEFAYSNAGFILLGRIIEKASGQSYFDYVREHIFRPAGMVHTDFYELDKDTPNLAVGYKDAPGGRRLSNLFDLSVKGSPAGNAYSTGEDMARFHQALVSGKLLSKPSRETLWTGVTQEPSGSEYGYGASIDSYNGIRIIGHGGGWKGVTNRFDMYPDLGYSVVILSNYDSDPTAIANRLREWLTQGRTYSPSRPGTTASPSPAPTPPVLTLTTKVSPSHTAPVSVGSKVSITVTVANAGGAVTASIVNLEIKEIKDAAGTKVHQEYTMGQKIGAGQTRSYSSTWSPSRVGTYTVSVGVFAAGWSRAYRFDEGVMTITVR
jgi:CubicO group peptidase (beta-lactamase class C family)